MRRQALWFIAWPLALIIAFSAGLYLGAKVILSMKSAEVAADAARIVELEREAEQYEERAVSVLDEIKNIYQGITCLASWYGFESGDMTANGEIYDPLRFTAAHRDLPFGTLLVIENISNGRMVVVRVNDRGPARRLAHRQLDLSFGAALELGVVERGLAIVRAWVVWGPTTEASIGRVSDRD